MFIKAKAIAALQAKKDRFKAYDANIADTLVQLDRALKRLTSFSQTEVEQLLKGIEWPGARPTDEFSRHPELIVPFSERWDDHEQARAWARRKLESIPTFAVDGSQLTPTKDWSIPVGAIQVGWYENPHRAGKTYIKDVDFRVLTPDELSDDVANGDDLAKWIISLRRFQGEVSRIIERMEQAAAESPKPVCLFDDSLVLSFVQRMRPDLQKQYIDAIVRLVETSEKTQVPLVGFIDTSYAKDLVNMLKCLECSSIAARVSDAALLRQAMNWGDRSQVYECARDDSVLSQYGAFCHQIGFAYLKTSGDGPPARLEFPLWLYHDGIVDDIIDIVRAECIVGTGYPYGIETADALAVISTVDRDLFYRTLQEFAEREGLSLRFSGKANSKRRRR